MKSLFSVVAALFVASAVLNASEDRFRNKPKPEAVLQSLMAGNKRFVAGKVQHPHEDSARRKLAANCDQADYAMATILSCSDSRVPVELIFDSGVMDLFVVRVPGNVCQDDEIGGIEYGALHAYTPLVMVLGHTNCGAVTATVGQVKPKKGDHKLETNIPALLKPIRPAVVTTMKHQPELKGAKLVEAACIENVYLEIENLFRRSPETLEIVKKGKVKIVGAVYDLATGEVKLLPYERIAKLHK